MRDNTQRQRFLEKNLIQIKERKVRISFLESPPLHFYGQIFGEFYEAPCPKNPIQKNRYCRGYKQSTYNLRDELRIMNLRIKVVLKVVLDTFYSSQALHEINQAQLLYKLVSYCYHASQAKPWYFLVNRTNNYLYLTILFVHSLLL